jgi:hypothetical protein
MMKVDKLHTQRIILQFVIKDSAILEEMHALLATVMMTVFDAVQSVTGTQSLPSHLQEVQASNQ